MKAALYDGTTHIETLDIEEKRGYLVFAEPKKNMSMIPITDRAAHIGEMSYTSILYKADYYIPEQDRMIYRRVNEDSEVR